MLHPQFPHGQNEVKSVLLGDAAVLSIFSSFLSSFLPFLVIGIVRSRHLTFSNRPGVKAPVLWTPVRTNTSSDGQELITRRLNVLHLSSKRKVGVKRDEDFQFMPGRHQGFEADMARKWMT